MDTSYVFADKEQSVVLTNSLKFLRCCGINIVEEPDYLLISDIPELLNYCKNNPNIVERSYSSYDTHSVLKLRMYCYAMHEGHIKGFLCNYEISSNLESEELVWKSSIEIFSELRMAIHDELLKYSKTFEFKVYE